MVTVYKDGKISFISRENNKEEIGEILRANRKEKTFNFEFSWERKKYFYSASITDDNGSFNGELILFVKKHKIPIKITEGFWLDALTFKGVWIEDNITYDFTITFKDLKIESE